MPPTIKPFRATYYNLARVKSLSAVACPPYDVITPQQLLSLRRRSPYNYTHINLSDNGNYKKVGQTFRAWLKQGILIDDSAECLYLYGQRFKVGRRVCMRFGILSLLKMDERAAVFPHERTLSRPKKDRTKITQAVQANLSPIFVITPKVLTAFQKAYRRYSARRPLFKFKDINGNHNFIWRIEDKALIAQICRQVRRAKLVIADGHHRFEVSYGYFQKHKKAFRDLNYTLVYIADAQPGLVILPIHRVVELKDSPKALFAKLAPYFSIKAVAERSLAKKLDSKGRFSFGLYLNKNFYFLKLRPTVKMNKICKDSTYRQLDTFILHQFILPLLKLEGVKYANNMSQVKSLTKRGKAAFIMRPAQVSAVHKIASRGYRLPQKSTYFYPKVGAGLVIRRFHK